MFDPIILSLIKQIANEGLDKETTKLLMDIIDTLLEVEDYNTINIVNIQTLLLLLQDFEIESRAKRLINELKYKIIRKCLNNCNEEIILNYTTTVMNRDIVEKIYDVNVTNAGKIQLDTTFSIQPLSVNEDELVLNDLGCLVLSTDTQDDMILATEKFKIARTGCCGIVRTDMIYPIGKECSEDSFKKEALDLAKTYNIGSDTRVSDTYSIEYFWGKPNQNFREAGKSLYLFELEKDNLWHYYKEGSEIFAKNLEELKLLWS